MLWNGLSMFLVAIPQRGKVMTNSSLTASSTAQLWSQDWTNPVTVNFPLPLHWGCQLICDSDFQTNLGGQDQEEYMIPYFMQVANEYPQVLDKFASITRNSYPYLLLLTLFNHNAQKSIRITPHESIERFVFKHLLILLADGVLHANPANAFMLPWQWILKNSYCSKIYLFCNLRTYFC